MSLVVSGCGVTQKIGTLSDRYNPFDEDGAERRAQSKAEKVATKAEAKATKEAERAAKAAAKAQAAKDKAAAKVQAAKEKAAGKAMRAEKKAAAKAKRMADKTSAAEARASAEADKARQMKEAAAAKAETEAAAMREQAAAAEDSAREMAAPAMEAPMDAMDAPMESQPPLPPVSDIVFDDESTEDAPPPAPAEIQTFEVVVPEDDYVFLPRHITIYEGDSILWRNNSGVVHLFASIPGSDPSGAMEIEPADLDVGARVTHTFEKAGTYPYFCFIHNRMTGKIEVLPR